MTTQAPTPNPFKDPQGFAAQKQGYESSSPHSNSLNQNPKVGSEAGGLNKANKDMPNPFVYPAQFKESRALIMQVNNHPSQSRAPNQNSPDQTHPASGSVTKSEESSQSTEQPKPADSQMESKMDPGNPFLDPVQFAYVKHKSQNIWRQTLEAVNDIAVVEVAHALGGFGGQDGDPNKYKIRGDNVQINGQNWYNFNDGSGSGGPISMVQHFENIDRFDDAVKWLADKFKNQIGTEAIKASAHGKPAEKPKFEAPENAPQFLENVRKYLHKERGISKELIERLIVEGRIYSDPHKNLVMISKTGNIAELRGTEPFQDRKTGKWVSIKQLKPGSDKSSGAFMVMPDRKKIEAKLLQNEKAFAIVEAGIDAMSYHMLHPGRVVASASGAEFTYPRVLFFDAYNNGFSFHCAFDKDVAGEKACQNIFNSAFLYQKFKEEGVVVEVRDSVSPTQPDVVPWMLTNRL